MKQSEKHLEVVLSGRLVSLVFPLKVKFLHPGKVTTKKAPQKCLSEGYEHLRNGQERRKCQVTVTNRVLSYLVAHSVFTRKIYNERIWAMIWKAPHAIKKKGQWYFYDLQKLSYNDTWKAWMTATKGDLLKCFI